MGGITLYTVVVKGNTKIKVDDATLIRSNLIPTSKWLEREAQRDEQIRLLNERLDRQREDYETRLEAKDKHIEEISAKFREEIAARDVQIEALKDEVKELRHSVKNVQAVQTMDAEVKKLTSQ